MILNYRPITELGPFFAENSFFFQFAVVFLSDIADKTSSVAYSFYHLKIGLPFVQY